MLQYSYCEANSCSAIQKINCFLWNSEVTCSVHEDSPTVPILSQINPVHINAPYLFQIHCNIILYLNYHKIRKNIKNVQDNVRSLSL
jgi:hypothetical protein